MIYRLKDLISETEPKVAMSGQFHAMFSKYNIQSKNNSDPSLYLAGWHGGYYLSPQNFTKSLKCKQIWKDLATNPQQKCQECKQTEKDSFDMGIFSIDLIPQTRDISGFVNGICCICSRPLSGFVTTGETHHCRQALHNNTLLPHAFISEIVLLCAKLS